MAPPAVPAKKPGGTGLSQHYGPLPLWGWIAAAVVGYLLYKKFTGASSSTATTTPTTTAATTAQTQPSWQGAGNPSGAVVSPGNTGTAAFTPPAVGSLVGSGYGPATGGVNLSASGQPYQQLTTPAQQSAFSASGGTAYIETTPGVFTPVGSGTGVAPGTPQYAQAS
jgi:hypothetical protein